ncbi:MAG TPA: sigma-54 dependent transcriptional regulator [Alphaproteobacteria bacterium]|nr:sigma-54 dependent transcriptional regulator [Alphaproteobacteria bacterium]
MKKDILIVDDEDDIRALIRGILEDEGYQVREAANASQALKSVADKTPDLMILDIWLQDSDKDGLEILKTVKTDNDILPVLMISGHGTIETAVTAIKQGAYDFIEKPFKSDRLLLMIARALETAALKQENRQLKARGDQQDSDLIGKSTAINQLRQQIERIAPTNSRVLITGDAGTGKEVIARMLHKLSERKDGPFMALNCAALHPERIEEELFGIQKDGKGHKGVLEMSGGGTLLLDEVADMPLETQGKILRVLQDNKVHPLGSQEVIDVDVRILASTNQDLQEAIKAGNFREDLYYRLNVVTLTLPPLHKRPEDIALLSDHFLKGFARQNGQEAKILSKEAKLVLQNYDWPGNVRQLKNVMEWITIMAVSKEEIKKEDLPPELSGHNNAANDRASDIDYAGQSLREAREAFEKNYLTMQVKRFKGNISQTAEFIGMERSALHRKLKSLDISLNDEQDKGQDSKSSLNQPSSEEKQKRA